MALLPSWAWVLAGCLSAAAGASDLSGLYPPLWEESPGQFSDYRVENGKYIIDPWIFTERMGAYRILLNQTAPYFEKYAPENEQNILWGLPLQHGWQYSSGRLVDPTGRTDCGYESRDHLCISVDSWWADINYFLSMLPFLAAVDSGIMGISSEQITLLPPPKDQTKFCYDVAGCWSTFPDIMEKWTAFFQYMQSPSSDFDGLLNHLWVAHTSSLKYPVTIFEDRYAYYVNPEADFEKNWAVAVNYLAAAQLPTTLTRSHSLQKGLASRMLLSTDKAPFIADFTPLQNSVLVALSSLGDTDRLTGSLSLAAWKISMKTEAARKFFLQLLENYVALST
uniref:RIKEN cDNA 2310057J18 gene n=1 Tax=Jaculus jaculus TaxID=51337 RepID=A0A8C5K623_JACJA|nr:protein LEG1 homolog [Jaculus jaculus]